jgi:hypothetical protein
LFHVEKAAADFAASKRVINTTDLRFNWRSMDYEAGCAWGRLQTALRKGGGEASWPVKDEFRPWIVDEVYPLLKFAVRGEPLVGQPISDDAEIDADAIQAKEEARDLKATRMSLDVPALQSSNVVELAQRQKRKAVDKVEA